MKRLNLIDQKFNKLTVLSFKEINKRGSSVWNCICECGIIKSITGSELKNGNSRSCGSCWKLNNNFRAIKSGESAFNCLYNSYKKRAKERNKTFNLTKDDFKILTKQNCHYCGNKPINTYG